MTTFSMTNGVTTITPWDRLGFESTNESRNILHQHLDNTVGISLFDDLPRSGTLTLLFLTAAAAESARAALAKTAIWTISDPVSGINGMTIVRAGSLDAAQQDARARWVLDVGYQEVS